MFKRIIFIFLFMFRSVLASDVPQPSSSINSDNFSKEAVYTVESATIKSRFQTEYFKAAIRDDITNSVCRLEPKKGVSMGSGVLCQIDGMKFILSAAHVDDVDLVRFYLGMVDNSILFLESDIKKVVPLPSIGINEDIQVIFLSDYPDELIDKFDKVRSKVLNIEDNRELLKEMLKKVKPLTLSGDLNIFKDSSIKDVDVYGYGITYHKKADPFQLFSHEPIFGLPSKIKNQITSQPPQFKYFLGNLIKFIRRDLNYTFNCFFHLPVGFKNMISPNSLYHPIQPGFSGGPVVMDGKIIAINSLATDYVMGGALRRIFYPILGLTPLYANFCYSKWGAVPGYNLMCDFFLRTIGVNKSSLDVIAGFLNIGIYALNVGYVEPVFGFSSFLVALSGVIDNPILNYASWGMSIINACYHGYNYWRNIVKGDQRVFLPQIRLGRVTGFSAAVAPVFNDIEKIVRDHYGRDSKVVPQ